MLNQIIEEAKSKETHSKDIESENKQTRNSPPRLRDHADSSNPINQFSQDFSVGSPLGDIQSQIRLQEQSESLRMSSFMGSQDINSRPLAPAKRALIMENQDIMDRRSSRPGTNERPGFRSGNIASILDVILDDEPT